MPIWTMVSMRGNDAGLGFRVCRGIPGSSRAHSGDGRAPAMRGRAVARRVELPACGRRLAPDGRPSSRELAATLRARCAQDVAGVRLGISPSSFVIGLGLVRKPPSNVSETRCSVVRCLLHQPFGASAPDGPLRPTPQDLDGHLRECSRIWASLKPNRLTGRPGTRCALGALSTGEFSAALHGGTTWDAERCCDQDTCRASEKFRTRVGHGAPQRKTGWRLAALTG